MQSFVSTREIPTRRNDSAKSVDFPSAILSPNAPNKGLWSISQIPSIDFDSLFCLLKSTPISHRYATLCKEVFRHFGLELDSRILQTALQSYDSFDNPSDPAPISSVGNAHFLELYHGPTRAFKDMALCPFGVIFSELIQKEQNLAKDTQRTKNTAQNYLILTATSGDTGPATLHSFANKPNIKVICLYPSGGTSQVQALQMQTQNASNLKVLGINGDFDTAQSLLKGLLNDEEFLCALETKSYALSAANSVNFGRIAFQIIYHIWGYFCLVESGKIAFGEDIYCIIPSGNFGNALGAFFAKCAGLDLRQIIIASNANNILSEIITSGVYDISSKKLHKSVSPAMDILKSSNVERVLFALFGAKRTNELMQSLESTNKYALEKSELEKLQEYFGCYYGNDSDTLELVGKAYNQGYILDTHTALGYGAYLELCAKKGADTKALICSTAQWSKFAPSVLKGIESSPNSSGGALSDFEAIAKMREKGAEVGEEILSLFDKPIVHKEVLEPSKVKEAILSWL